MFWTEVGNTRSWKVKFNIDADKWDHYASKVHQHVFLTEGRFSTYLNWEKECGHGDKAFSGKYPMNLIQGCTINPPFEDDIAPFKIYATNSYGVNRSTACTDRPTCRFDVVEVNIADKSTYCMVIAVITVDRKG